MQQIVEHAFMARHEICTAAVEKQIRKKGIRIASYQGGSLHGAVLQVL
jgi:hypothetical protein